MDQRVFIYSIKFIITFSFIPSAKLEHQPVIITNRTLETERINIVSYHNHTVFRIIPNTDEQLKILKNLHDWQNGYEYWIHPDAVSQPADLMVPPEQTDKFNELMNANNITHSVLIENVQDLIDQENRDRKKRDNTFSFSDYSTLGEIYNWFDTLALQYPDNIKVVVGGRTYQGRDIKGVKLSFGKNKPGVFLEGGIHPREWISTATVTYLLNELLMSEEPDVRKLAEAYTWYMFPVFNPDGYEYTHFYNRLWRKTLSKTSPITTGVDANRNWDSQWMTSGGTGADPRSEVYAGSSPFSEIETRTLSNYIKSLGNGLFAYIDFHSYRQLLMFPYGYTQIHLDNYDQSLCMANKGANALSRRYGTTYKIGNIAETAYPASGSSIDWVKANLKLPVTFIYELRDQGNYGFLLPANQIIPTGQEVLDSLIAIFNEASKYGYSKHQITKNI